jgi:hypothetical protein
MAALSARPGTHASVARTWCPRVLRCTLAPTGCRRASGVAEGVDTAEGTLVPTPNPSAAIVVLTDGEKAFAEANCRRDGQHVTPGIGPAWLDRDPATSEWDRRRGRVGDGS